MDVPSQNARKRRRFDRFNYYHENYDDNILFYRYYPQPPFTYMDLLFTGAQLADLFDSQSGITGFDELPSSFYYSDGSVNLPKLSVFIKAREAYVASFDFTRIYVPVSADFYGIAERAFPGIQTAPTKLSDGTPIQPIIPNNNNGNNGQGNDKPRNWAYYPQSGVTHVDSVSDETKQTITSFCDENSDWHANVQHSKDDSYYIADNSDTSLTEFFSRPIRIVNQQWATNSAINIDFNPWQLYYANPRVVNRIANYRNLRSNLCVKVLINGNPFYYGRAILSYNPLPAYDNFTDTSIGAIANIIGASQRPHLYLDPTTSQGGTMTLPFVWWGNSCDIPLFEMNQLGNLSLRTIVPLKHVNGANETITISIFAWAEDVVLSVPTIQEPAAIAPQSGVIDEYNNRETKNKKPSVMIKKVIIPKVAKYARATVEALKLAGEMATLMGLSRPLVLEPVKPIRHLPHGVMATTDLPDTVAKLSLDSKQEVTIDPRTVGLAPTDEMSIVQMAMRESYLTTFAWGQTAPVDTPLFSSYVTPMLYDAALAGAFPAIHQTMASFAALPFKYWRGTMRFRFQVVSSSFHKGRLRITWDPIGPNPISEFNTQYSHIVDIGAETDFSLEIGWGATLPYLISTKPRTVTPATLPFKIAAPFTLPPDVANTNGILTVYVMNELTSPAIVVSDISVMVSVAACEDFQVFEPDPRLTNYSYYPQSGSMMNMTDPERGAPVEDKVCRIFGKRIPMSDESPLICHGDSVHSVRTLMKRYVLLDTHALSPAITTVPQRIQLNYSAFPYYRGNAPGAIHVKAAGFTNYCSMTPINYFTPAYCCRKGGLRVKMSPVHTGPGTISSSSITKGFTNTYSFTTANMSLGSASAVAKDSIEKELITTGGAAAFSNTLAHVADAEIPYASNLRFYPARFADMTLSNPFNQSFSYQTILPTVVVGQVNHVTRYVSTAEDFSLFWLLSAPKIFPMFTGYPV